MPIETYHHPALTVDVVLFSLGQKEPELLLIQRGRKPFKGSWAFPGGFVDVGEPPRDAAVRELWEEAGIRDVPVEQLRAFGDPERDPRGHTVTIAYLAWLTSGRSPAMEAGSDAARARWWPVRDLPRLAFDHAEILSCALVALCSELSCVPPELETREEPLPELSASARHATCRALLEVLEDTRGRQA